jgi:hypothetical protein
MDMQQVWSFVTGAGIAAVGDGMVASNGGAVVAGGCANYFDARTGKTHSGLIVMGPHTGPGAQTAVAGGYDARRMGTKLTVNGRAYEVAVDAVVVVAPDGKVFADGAELR